MFEFVRRDWNSSIKNHLSARDAHRKIPINPARYILTASLRILRQASWPRASQRRRPRWPSSRSASRGCPLSPAGIGRVFGPNRSGDRRVRPAALHLRIEADSATATRSNLWPDSQFAGAARASGACDWNIQKRSNNRCEKPEIEQKRSKHPKTLKYV